MTCCLKADAFSIPSSNYRDVRHDKWFHMDSSGYEGASAKNDEILGRKEPGFCFKYPFFFTDPTILQVLGSLGTCSQGACRVLHTYTLRDYM